MASFLLSNNQNCTGKCRSNQHMHQLIVCLSKSPANQTQIYWLMRCRNFWHQIDEIGRSLVHWSAARGKREVLLWILETFGADVNAKDTESGYTPVHVALLHGQIACAQILIDHGALLTPADREGLTGLDIVRRDRWWNGGGYCSRDPTEIYSFGENASYTLGHTHPTARLAPEPVDFFRRLGLAVKKVCMSKLHTLFLTKDGTVYSCGHGLGGRLGLGNDSTTFAPQLIEFKHKIVDIAAANDHSVFIDEKGIAYACGRNLHGQLGLGQSIEQSLQPEQIQLGKNQRAHFISCAAGACHTVLWTDEMTVWTFGFNFGQLGHAEPKNAVIWFPKKIPAFGQTTSTPAVVSHRKKSDSQSMSFATKVDLSPTDASKNSSASPDRFLATSCDSAVVIATARGDVFLCVDYERRRIVSKQLDLAAVHVTGTRNATDQSGSKGAGQKENQPIRVVGLTVAGTLWVWDEKTAAGLVKKCLVHGLGVKQLYFVDIALNNKGLFLAAEDGSAFRANFSAKEKDWRAGLNRKTPFNSTLPQPGETQIINLAGRLPNVHRCVCVFSDPSGTNGAFIQSDPSTDLTEVPQVSEKEISCSFGQLLEQSSVDDLLVDLVIHCGNQLFAVHKFVVYSRAPELQTHTDEINEWILPEIGSVNVQPVVFEQFLQYLYTDWCDLLQAGFTIGEIAEEMNAAQAATKTKKRKKKKTVTEEKPTSIHEDPIKQLHLLAKHFGVRCLLKKLESVRWQVSNSASENASVFCGTVHGLPYKGVAGPKLAFSTKMLVSLKDVRLRCTDGMELSAHRCVLAARLDYFRSMLCSGWLESSKNPTDVSSALTLSLPVPGDIGLLLLHYLYTDELPPIYKQLGQLCGEVPEALCTLLVTADQLLMTRLREFCERDIAKTVSCRNVVELLQFSKMYNAHQLGNTCLQFISLNLSSFIEANALQTLDYEILDDIGRYYRQMFDQVGGRLLTPMPGKPTTEELQMLWAQFESSELTLDELCRAAINEQSIDANKSIQKPPKQRNRKDSKQESQHDSSFECVPSPSPPSLLPTPPLAQSPEPANQQPTQQTPKKTVFKKFKQLDLAETPPVEQKQSWLKLRPWGSPQSESSPSDQPFVSLRDVMAAEQQFQATVTQPKAPVQPLPKAKSPQPWSRVSPVRTSSISELNNSFTEIIREEEGKAAERRKQESRPLGAIQMEEEAMQQLLQMYAKDDCLEWVTVERVTKHKAAEPVWSAHVHK